MQLIRYCLVMLLIAVSTARSENALRNEISSYLDVLTCAVRTDPWQCVYSRSGKILDSLDAVVRRKEDELKGEADAEFAQRLASRAFTDTDISEKDKPSEIISSLENAVSDTVGSLIERAKGDKKKKMKKKKKPSVQLVEFQKPQIYELVEESDGHGHGHGGHMGGHHGGGGHGHGHGGLGGHGGHGLKMKKHGRSIGAKRGKHKKKKKKALMKLLLIGAVLKAKIELLLKIVTTHLQIKFFMIAVIGLLINIARFWVDLKRGHQPQKVVYYEHAHHQHVYDDHEDSGWGLGSSGSGSYWKRRSLNEKGEPVEVAFSDGFNSGPPVASPATYDPTYRQYENAPSSYGNIVPSASTYTDPHSIVYSKQKPDSYSGFL